MKKPSGEKEQQKKLYMVVGGIMCVVILLWVIVLYPRALKRAVDSSGGETENFLDGVDSARQGLDEQLEQRKTEQVEQLNSLPQEEIKGEIDVPRLPAADVAEPNEDIQKESE